MMFCKAVSQFELDWCPANDELGLVDSVSYPVEMHVNCMGMLLFDGVISNAIGSGVVDKD